MPARILGHWLDRLRRTLRGRNAIANGFELWVGLAGAISCIVFFWQPGSLDGNALSRVIGYDLSEAWVIAYGLAGVLIWYGLLYPSPTSEVVGLWLLGSATFVEAVAIASVFGWRGSPTTATLAALTLASWTRAVTVQADVLRLSGRIEGEGSDDGGG